MAGPVSSSRQYNYKKPSSFNFVSLLLILGLLAGGYWVFKFGPIYYNRFKVDEILREGSAEASGIRKMEPLAQTDIEQKVVANVIDRIERRGITRETHQLSVYFAGDDATLNADYVYVVRHPVGKPTTVRQHRSVSVP